MSILRLENIKIRKDISDSEVLAIACNIFNISEKYVIDYKIVKKSIDARDKNDIFYNYSIIVTLKDDFNIFKLVKNKNVVLLEKANQVAEKVKVLRTSSKKPVIIGAGPAGLFCALTLVENGIKPIIVEQGKKVEERKKDVDTFL